LLEARNKPEIVDLRADNERWLAAQERVTQARAQAAAEKAQALEMMKGMSPDQIQAMYDQTNLTEVKAAVIEELQSRGLSFVL